MKPPRVLVAGLFHESHSFVSGYTHLSDCTVRVGEDLLAMEADGSSPLGATLQTARELGWEVVPALDLRAIPGAVCAAEVLDLWWPLVEAQLKSPLDGIFLVLHGAMVGEGVLDVEGEVLQRIRSIIGPRLPIGGVTDLHANFTPAMAQHSNALLTYRENPHTDGAATARRAALLFDRLVRGASACTYFQPTEILWAPTWTATAQTPMLDLEERARKTEKLLPQVWAVNVHAGYAYADTPHTGVSFSAVYESGADVAEVALAMQSLAALAAELDAAQRTLPQQELPLEVAIAELRASLPANGPVLLVEAADNIGGGAPGDATHLLRAFAENGIANAGVAICDGAAVASCADRVPGESFTLQLGAWSGPLAGTPFKGSFTLVSRGDGRFQLEDEHSHQATMQGLNINMGPSVLLRLNAHDILVLLSTRPCAPFDLGQWRSQGVDPESLTAIGIKAAVGHRQAYKRIASREIFVRTPGVCASDLTLFSYQYLQHKVPSASPGS